jgi:hypothetical protein
MLEQMKSVSNPLTIIALIVLRERGQLKGE